MSYQSLRRAQCFGGRQPGRSHRGVEAGDGADREGGGDAAGGHDQWMTVSQPRLAARTVVMSTAAVVVCRVPADVAETVQS
jgi:hypothetical protein